MSSQPTSPPPHRGRTSRGGYGKYLRARGRGHGRGRGAEFTERIYFEGDRPEDLDEEEAAELQRKFAKRNLGSNADRYKEEEPELGSDGEPIPEPEVDLSSFLEKQRISGRSVSTQVGREDESDEDDIEQSLAHLPTSQSNSSKSKKGKVTSIEWTEDLEVLHREKSEADANRDLKSRFRAKSEKLKTRPISAGSHVKTSAIKKVEDAPALPGAPAKAPKEEMEDFLDDLLG